MVAIDEKLKRMPYTVRVGNIPGGLSEFISVQAAIDYCDNETGDWVIQIWPGTYVEGDLTSTGGANITLKGMGTRRVVIAPVAAPAAAVIVSTHTLTIERLTVTAPDATRPALRVTGGNCDVIESILSGAAGGNCIEQVGGELNLVLAQSIDGNIDLRDAACTLNIGHCSLFVTGGVVVTNDGAGAGVLMTISAEFTEFHGATFTLGATGACIYFFDRCTGMANIADASLLGTGTLRECHVAGTGLNKTGTTDWDIFVSFLTAISNTNATGIITVYGGNIVSVACSAGLIRLRNCLNRVITRTATGNIVDESPQLQDAPWKVHKWDWMTALASMDVAVRGTPLDAGSGQVLLEVDTAAAADQEAVETNPEVAGSLSNEFTPARTPRFITQIVVDNFHADADMFFGLRETLGDYVPAATEQHAGFIWNGANFQASSDDGAATEATNLTTPTVNTHVQLEVIVFGGVSVEFYVDGILVATHTTRVPSAALDWQHLLNNGAGGGAAGDIDVTVRNGGCAECPS